MIKNTLTMLLLASSLLVLMFSSGCGFDSDAPSYQDKILSWQAREATCQQQPAVELTGEGFTDRKELIDALVKVIHLAPRVQYAPDADGDSWQTSCQVADSLRGDCEDIAAYNYALIRQAQIVPDYQLSIRVVEQPESMDDHVVIVIAYEDGNILVDYLTIWQVTPAGWNTVVEYDLWSIF